jgi:hypothetical protein
MKPADTSVYGNNRLNWILFLVFSAGLGYYQFSFHEFWKDEWQAWFIATEAPDLRGMVQLLSAEGHPILWFLLLRLTHQAASVFDPDMPAEYLIQTVHWLITVGAAWLLFFRFRFPLLIRLLFACSYFFLFEYGVVNRGYSLVILFLFALVPLLENPRKHPVSIGVLLFLLTQTEVFGLFAAGAIAVYVCITGYAQDKIIGTKDKVIPVLFLLFGTALFFLSMLPSHLTPEGGGWGQSFVSLYAHTLSIGISPPVKEADLFSWILSLVLLSLIVILLWKNKPLCVAYLLFSGAFLVFCAVFYSGGPRQWGLHWVFLIVVLQFIPFDRKEAYTFTAYVALLILLIPAQLLYTARILVKEKKYLFSNAIEAGKYIKQHIPGQVPILGINKPYCTPVIGYSGHRFFSLPEGELFSYAVFREKMYLPTDKEIVKFYDQHGRKDLYVLSWKRLPEPEFSDLEPVVAFDKPSIREEDYYLYKVNTHKTGVGVSSD